MSRAPRAEPSRSVPERTRAALGAAVGVLLLGHVIPLFVLGRGAAGLDWNTLAARWAHLPWRIWDLLLVLAAGALAGLTVHRWWHARAGRTLAGICCAAIVVAGVVAGVLSIVTLNVDLR